jgi:hypothetical protein
VSEVCFDDSEAYAVRCRQVDSSRLDKHTHSSDVIVTMARWLLGSLPCYRSPIGHDVFALHGYALP